MDDGTHGTGAVYGRKTIQQLARGLDVDLREVSKAARRVLGLDSGSARDRRFVLSSTQCRQVADALGKKPQPSLLGLAEVDDAPPPAPRGRARPRFRSDPPADLADLKLRDLRHGLWVHPEVSDRLREWTHLYKRLGIVLQHLAAHGRSTVVKGCRDANRGWRRSPLGGSNGMQYYLWWTPCGSPAARTLDVPERAILVRDVRHHDDHAPLAAGDLGDYLPLTTPEHLNEDIAGSPWTDEQIDFVEDDNPVRLILGRPGSGKTTVLWKAVEARSRQRVLYLTWSSALTRHAEERFASFAPADVEVIARDFTTFLGEVCGADVERQPLGASRARFDQVLTRLGRDMAGPWARRQHALHAELRAVYFGRAIPGDRGCVTDHGIACLSDGTYGALRGEDNGFTGAAGVGVKAAKALLKVAQRLARDPGRVGSVFPELVAATRAIERLRADELPEGFEAFDRIVVDEVQDLTLLETAVVVELCGAIARARGRAPWLLMAGDAGQTVRPTGFEWAPLNDLLALRLRRPEKFHLDEHLRCPSRIAEVVERASRRYADIEKEVRPTRQRRQRGGEHVDAHLVHVHVSERAEAVRLLEGLDETDDVVVVSPRNDPPDWVPAGLRGVVLTPEETKGLEYQSVCVLDAGRLLSGLGPDNLSYGIDAELDQPARRTAIDHLRVTLSRATETLVFVDVEAGDDDLQQSRELLGDAAPYSPEDLLEHLAHSDASAEERVSARTNDARALIDSAPRRAWQRACQAVRLLGEPGLPNGVSDPVVRGDARSTVLATAARLLVDGVPEGVQRREVVAMAMAVARGDEAPDEFGAVRPDADAGGGRAAEGGGEQAPPVALAPYENMALRELDFWSRDRRAPPFDLLEAARQLGTVSEGGGDWLRAALLSGAQALRDGLSVGAADPASAAAFAGADVEAWLRLTGYAGDATARAHALRGKAFDALLKGGGANERRSDRRARLVRAESVLEAIAPDPVRLGRLREAQDRPEDAVAAYDRAGRQKDALRVLRNFGRWERAVELADGETRADLDWLLELQALVERRPPQQNRRLRNAERDRLEKLLDEIQKRPPRKTMSASG